MLGLDLVSASLDMGCQLPYGHELPVTEIQLVGERTVEEANREPIPRAGANLDAAGPKKALEMRDQRLLADIVVVLNQAPVDAHIE